MLKPIYTSKSLIILVLSSLASPFIVNLATVAQAKTTKDQEKIVVPDRRSPGGTRGPTDSSGIQLPSRREPGGSRTTELRAPGGIRTTELARAKTFCNFNQEGLTALIPRDLLGITASNSPTLFFVLPAIPKSTTVEFVLRDQNDQLVYETTLKGMDKAGIMSLQIPSKAKENDLKFNQEYHWYLSVICNAQDRSHDIVVEGLIKRVELNSTITEQLAQADPLEKVKLYQSQNLWQDTLAVLVELKRSHPNDPKVIALWENLLKSVDLDRAIAHKPLTVQ